jgi:hypothetical protein
LEVTHQPSVSGDIIPILRVCRFPQLPPRDLLEEVRKDTFEGFSRIFAGLKDDGRNSEKMLAALNAFLLSDGLDLGEDVATLHTDVHAFMHTTWLNTTDRRMKATLVTYARLQMQLQGVQLLQKDTGALSELVELVTKDLDQGGGLAISSRSATLGARDKPHDDRLGSVQPQLRCLLELAAVVFSEAARYSVDPDQAGASRKRQKKQAIFDQVLEKALAGKGSWPGAFCLWVHRRHSSIPQGTLLGWLQAFVEALPESVNAASISRNTEPLAWMLRCLVELAAKWPSEWGKGGEKSAAELRKEREAIASLWQSVWQAALGLLLHQAGVPMVAEEALRLLGCLASRGLVAAVVAPPELFELRAFTETCTPGAVHFVAAFFSGAGPHFMDLGPEQVVQLRKRLLQWGLQLLSASPAIVRGRATNESYIDPVLVQSALLALAAGFHMQPDTAYQPFWESTAWWNPADEAEKEKEEEISLLDRSGKALAFFASQTAPSDEPVHSRPGKGRLPSLLTARLMSHAAAVLSDTVLLSVEQSKQQPDPAQLLQVCAACARCLDEVEAACKDG